jgi:hypothetical protein
MAVSTTRYKLTDPIESDLTNPIEKQIKKREKTHNKKRINCA